MKKVASLPLSQQCVEEKKGFFINIFFFSFGFCFSFPHKIWGEEERKMFLSGISTLKKSKNRAPPSICSRWSHEQGVCSEERVFLFFVPTHPGKQIDNCLFSDTWFKVRWYRENYYEMVISPRVLQSKEFFFLFSDCS